MPSSIDDFCDQYGRGGTLSQIAVTIFVGIPSTIALVTGLAVYCTFRYLTSCIFRESRKD